MASNLIKLPACIKCGKKCVIQGLKGADIAYCPNMNKVSKKKK